jgi:AcrR family transcriptional regulator
MVTDTKDQLIRAGEKLFAEQGVHRVRLRELNEAAGQRNASALHYHFGSRDGLLRAIVERHRAVVDRDRARRLAALGGDPDVHDLVEVVLAPLADRLLCPGGRDYLRIVPQLFDQLDLVPPAMSTAIEILTAHLDAVPADLRAERLRAMAMASFTLLADRAATEEPALEHSRFVGNLVDMATAMLVAPTRPGRREGP